MDNEECRFSCPSCGTEVVSLVPGIKKCNGAGCQYFFEVFSKRDEDEGRNAYLLQPSKGLKYFGRAPDDRWYIGFTEKTEPFIAETLCDLIMAPVLQTIQEGLAKRLKTAITILVKFRDRPSSLEGITLIETDGNLLGRIDPIDKRAFFNNRCLKIRDPFDGPGDNACLLFDAKLAIDMIREDNPSRWKPKWYTCWSGLIDFIAPVVINDYIAAVMFTGQIRWTDPEGETYLKEGCRKVNETIAISSDEAYQLAEIPGQRKMNRSELDAFLARFVDQVEIVKALAESRYWTERRVRESEFMSEVFSSFAAVDDEESLWKVLSVVLGRINEFSLFAHSAFFFCPDEYAEGFIIKARAGSVPLEYSVLKLTPQEIERIFQKEALYRVREAQETRDESIYIKILQLMNIAEANCMFLFPLVISDSRRGFVLLAERKRISPDRISQGVVSSRRQDFLEKLIHEIKIEVQNALHISDLRKALQDRSELMANAGHLLVAPLDAAYGKTERLKLFLWNEQQTISAKDIKEIKRLCDGIDKDIMLSIRKTRSFMFFATMGTAAEQYRFDKETSLSSILGACKEDFEDLASTRGISITIDIHDAIPSAHFDGEKLQIVFNNLLDNAIKYSHANQLIRLEQRFDKTNEVYTTSVSDFGLGIPPEERISIFDPYIRSKFRDPRRFIPGTGIGLSVVKRIVDKHGGKVWVTCTQGVDTIGRISSLVEGFNTTFWVQLHKRRRNIE